MRIIFLDILGLHGAVILKKVSTQDGESQVSCVMLGVLTSRNVMVMFPRRPMCVHFTEERHYFASIFGAVSLDTIVEALLPSENSWSTASIHMILNVKRGV